MCYCVERVSLSSCLEPSMIGNSCSRSHQNGGIYWWSCGDTGHRLCIRRQRMWPGVRKSFYLGSSSEGPADGVPGQQERAAWGAAAREEEGR